jgi:hypothetical protein
VTPTETTVVIRITNTGKPVWVSDYHLALDNGATDRSFQSTGQGTPMLLQKPLIFLVGARDLARNLSNKGCTGTCRVMVVVEPDSGKPYTESFEMPNVESLAWGKEPV